MNHGYRGDLRIEAPAHPGRGREFVQAAMELGYPNVDLNAPFKEGEFIQIISTQLQVLSQFNR